MQFIFQKEFCLIFIIIARRLTDNETPECKAEADAKAELTSVSEHFKEVSNAAIWRLIIREAKKDGFRRHISRSLQAIQPMFILVQ